jgi:OOP family OmpA-OmpF porin
MLINRAVVRCASVLTFSLAATAAAQSDAADCKDHPMLSRMTNYYIGECKTAFDAQEFYVADGPKTIEGRKTVIDYSLVTGSTMPSILQIRRNYSNAIKSLGGTVLYDQERQLTGKVVTKAGNEVWMRVEGFNDGRDYTVTVVEIEAMKQEVSAHDMLDSLNKNGFIALYLNFDTGQSDVKTESLPVISQIVKLLQDNPALLISVEGHTDNVGIAASNRTLSELRARSVMAAVVKGGIAAGRLSSLGWGQEKPMADNRTEEGRARNRRVEIVKRS